MNFIKNNFILIIILIFSAILRINQDIFIQGYNFDEIAICSLAKDTNIIKVLKNIATQDYHAPLYYLIISPFLSFENEWLYVRFLNVFFSILNVYVFYKIGNLINNEKCGYILATILCVSHIHIMTTSFIKFYCFCFLLISLIIYYLIQVIKNQKNYIKLGIFNALFALSSTFGIVFIFFEYLILFFIKKIDKKILLKSFLISFLGFLFYLPFLIIQAKTALSNIVSPHSAYPSFSLFGIWSIFNDYLTPMINYSVSHDTIEGNTLLLKWLKSLSINRSDNLSFFSYIIFCLIPIMAGIYLLILNLKQKISQKIFIIATLNLFFFFILSILEITGLIPLYLYFFGITILILIGYEISLIKSNKIQIAVLIYFLFIQLIIPNSYPIKKRTLEKAKIYTCPIEYIKKINDEEFVITTLGGRFLEKYFYNKKIFSFDNEQMGASHDKKLINLIYNPEIIAKTNKKNAKNNFSKMILEKYKNENLEKYFKDNIFNKMKKGEKITLILYSDEYPFIANENEIKKLLSIKKYDYHLTNSSLNYQLIDKKDEKISTEQLSDLIQSYSYNQLIALCDKYFKRIKIEQFSYDKNNLKWKKTFESENFNKDTIWIAENVILGWIFVTYQK